MRSPSSKATVYESLLIGPTGESPRAIAVDDQDCVFTANGDSGDVTKIDSHGRSATFARLGEAPAWGMSIDSHGSLYVPSAESGNLFRVDQDGNAKVFADVGGPQACIGSQGRGGPLVIGRTDGVVMQVSGSGEVHRIGEIDSYPEDVCVDREGNALLVSCEGQTLLRLAPNGSPSVLLTFGKLSPLASYSGDFPSEPAGVAVDERGTVFTANYGSNNVCRIDPDGKAAVLGSTGDGPYRISLDDEGNVYTCNLYSCNVTKISHDGISQSIEPSGEKPRAIAVDEQGCVYTANEDSNDVTKFTPS